MSLLQNSCGRDPLRPVPLVLLGIPFHNVTFQEAVAWSVERMKSRRPGYIVTANLDFVMQAWRDPELQRILLEADLVVADGAPLVWVSPLFGPRLKERVTGSDITPMLAAACLDNGLSLFNLGAGPGVAENAAAELQRRYPGLKIAGCWSPPLADVIEMDHAEILARLRAANPDLLLVAFGAPKQEKWINMHVREWAVPLAVGVGGTLDFLAGVQVRAPRWVQRIGLEWFWRMATNPRRLFKRYAGNFGFLFQTLARLLPLRYGAIGDSEEMPDLPSVAELGALEAVSVVFRPLADEGTALAFVDELAERPGRWSFVVDLRGVPWLSSLELGALVQLGKACRARGGRLILWAPGARIRRLVETCRLDLYLAVAKRRNELLEVLRVVMLANRSGAVQLEGDRLSVRLPLELTAANLPEFRRILDDAWERVIRCGSLKEIAVDAAGLEFVDSAALGFLVGLKKRAEGRSARLRCFGFRAAALRAVKLARLESVLGA